MGTISYLWGGFTLDVYDGRFLREHHDLDYLTENLACLKPRFIEQFEARGWQAQKLANGDLRLIKNNIRVHLGNIQFSEVAIWTHNGENGAISFPVEWLKSTPTLFQGAAVHVVEPEFECVLKHYPQLLNPDWKPRDKDIIARKQLREMITKRNNALDGLYSLVTERLST
ncbi:MAG: hypothetical protein GY803_31540 [Chloroflexi bacterium]|nr:hypothetical protein [Chloroflexota bacterium]